MRLAIWFRRSASMAVFPAVAKKERDYTRGGFGFSPFEGFDMARYARMFGDASLRHR